MKAFDNYEIWWVTGASFSTEATQWLLLMDTLRKWLLV